MPKALVIDDNRAAADGLSELLRLLGLEAEVAYGPRMALLALQRIRPDVVFVDIHMPGIEGHDIIAYLRRDRRLAQVPVIVVTSDDQPETHAKARRLGAADVLLKPATVEQAENALRKLGLL